MTGTYPVRRASILPIARVSLPTIHASARGVRCCCLRRALPFSLLLPRLMSPAAGNALVVAVHAVDTLACLREDELVDSVLAYLALETMGMVGVVAGHDGLVEDRLLADIAAI